MGWKEWNIARTTRHINGRIGKVVRVGAVPVDAVPEDTAGGGKDTVPHARETLHDGATKTNGSDDQLGGRGAPLHIQCADAHAASDAIYGARDEFEVACTVTAVTAAATAVGAGLGSIASYQLRDLEFVYTRRIRIVPVFTCNDNQLRDQNAAGTPPSVAVAGIVTAGTQPSSVVYTDVGLIVVGGWERLS
jgi:hypothetical protein